MRSLLIVATLLMSACSSPQVTFTSADDQAVRALEEAYRTGWLANDRAAVLATLDPDAVLMPAGIQPLIGHSAIHDYWWPDDGSATTIHAYEIVVDEIEGSGDLAYLRGRGSLDFTYEDSAGVASRIASEAVHLSVAQRDETGKWHIVRRSWSAIR